MITTEAERTPLAVAPAEGPRSLADIHPRMPLMLTPTAGTPGSTPPAPIPTPCATCSPRPRPA